MKKPVYKDPRYTTVQLLLKENAIRSFQEIFTFLPYTIAARDLRVNNNRMKAIKNGDIYSEDVINRLADLIGCPDKKLLTMAENQYIRKHGRKP